HTEREQHTEWIHAQHADIGRDERDQGAEVTKRARPFHAVVSIGAPKRRVGGGALIPFQPTFTNSLYYLLEAGDSSHWHRVRDAAEVWHFYAGDALLLRLWDGKHSRDITLGPDLARGERPQAVVPAGCWQSARPLGRYTLVGCTVAPGFEFASFEMAAPDWNPPAA